VGRGRGGVPSYTGEGNGECPLPCREGDTPSRPSPVGRGTPLTPHSVPLPENILVFDLKMVNFGAF